MPHEFFMDSLKSLFCNGHFSILAYLNKNTYSTKAHSANKMWFEPLEKLKLVSLSGWKVVFWRHFWREYNWSIVLWVRNSNFTGNNWKLFLENGNINRNSTLKISAFVWVQLSHAFVNTVTLFLLVTWLSSKIYFLIFLIVICVTLAPREKPSNFMKHWRATWREISTFQGKRYNEVHC